MKKTFIFLFLISNLLHADYLFQYNNTCLKTYWFKDNRFYFVYSDGLTSSSGQTNFGGDIFDGYEYNSTSGECKKIPTNNTLGMKNEDFNYLNALVAILISVLMIWSLVW